MSKQFRMASLWCIGLALTAQAAFGAEAAKWSGSFEGGFSTSWTGGGTGGNQFLVDNLNFGKTFDVTDKTRVVFDQSFQLNGAGTAGGTFNHNSRSYNSVHAALTVGQFTLANRALYLHHQCSEKVGFSVGHFGLGYGMESLWNRYDMNTYYYTHAYGVARGYGFTYGVGFKVGITDALGNWQFAIVDNRTFGDGQNLFPSLAIGWNWELKGGSWSLTPVITAHLGKIQGGFRDFGFSGGAMFKANMFWLNAEFNLVQTGFATRDTSLWFEPGLDLGAIALSAKLDVARSPTTNDINLGGAISHEYADKYRVKLAYMHTGLSGNINAHGNDIRLLFGTKW